MERLTANRKRAIMLTVMQTEQERDLLERICERHGWNFREAVSAMISSFSDKDPNVARMERLEGTVLALEARLELLEKEQK
jgi:hypothetical protein